MNSSLNTFWAIIIIDLEDDSNKCGNIIKLFVKVSITLDPGNINNIDCSGFVTFEEWISTIKKMLRSIDFSVKLMILFKCFRLKEAYCLVSFENRWVHLPYFFKTHNFVDAKIEKQLNWRFVVSQRKVCGPYSQDFCIYWKTFWLCVFQVQLSEKDFNISLFRTIILFLLRIHENIGQQENVEGLTEQAKIYMELYSKRKCT